MSGLAGGLAKQGQAELEKKPEFLTSFCDNGVITPPLSSWKVNCEFGPYVCSLVQVNSYMDSMSKKEHKFLPIPVSPIHYITKPQFTVNFVGTCNLKNFPKSMFSLFLSFPLHQNSSRHIVVNGRENYMKIPPTFGVFLTIYPQVSIDAILYLKSFIYTLLPYDR